MRPGSLLAAYRATGADPPFGDPRRAHGVPLEGYFWRLTDAAAGRVVVALCGAFHGPRGSWSLVALASHPGGFLRSAVGPAARPDPGGLAVRVGEVLQATEHGLRVDLGPDARLGVRLDGRSPWPRRSFGGLGPAHSMPGLGQYWHPHLLGARVSGDARLGADEVSLHGATAYAEKNWGAGFPSRWWWGQAHGFDHADVCLAFAGGAVTVGPARVHATSAVVRVGAEVIRVVPPLGLLRTTVDDSTWRLRGRTGRHTVEIDGHGNGTAPHVLPVPLPAERRTVDTAHQHLAGVVHLRVRRRGRVVFDGDSQLAGLERGTG